MANRIDAKFRELKKKKKKAFVAFIMAGDPSLNITKELVLELERQGADIVELGVPFSDPLADGPTIQRSSERALKNKVDVASVCGAVKDIRLKSDIPIVFLTYYNLIHNYGLGRFVRDAKASGVDGVVVPDLPPEESSQLRSVAKDKGLSVIHLIAPTSSTQRVKSIASSSTGFIYYVSLTGTTGERRRLPREISGGLRAVKKLTKKPVCVGFGVSRPEQARSILRLADGVIVGSAIIKVIEKNIGRKGLVKKTGIFTGRLIRGSRR